MLANIKIRTRLFAGFSVAMLGLIIVIFISINKFSTLNNKVDQLVHDKYQKSEWVSNVEIQISEAALSVRNYLLADDDGIRQKEMQQIDELTKKVGLYLDSLKQRITTEKGKELLAAITAVRNNEYKPTRDKLFTEYNIGNMKGVKEILYGELTKIQQKYFDAVMALDNYQAGLVITAGDEANDINSSSAALLWILGASILAFILIATFYITNSITKPVEQVKERLGQLETVCITNLGNGLVSLTKGDLTAKVEKATKHLNFTMKDEIGDMARVFDAMLSKAQAGIDAYEMVREKINMLTVEIKSLIEDSKNGLLDNRGQTDKFEGVYRELVRGMNEMLDAVILPVQDGARVLEIMATGDFSPRVTADYKGQHKMIKESINNLGDSIGDILNEVGSAVGATASASNQISSSTEEMAAGSQEQSAQTSEIASAVEQMTKTILETTHSASTASESAKNAGNIAKEGGKVVNETIEGMGKIAAVVKQSAETVQALGKSSDQIGEIVQVIDDIADQTNLLALNAAIEAARAGEQGRGFAVVADEVRKLAERTTKATKEIASMIKQIQKDTIGAVESMQRGTEEVEKGKILADKAGQSLKDIIKGADEVVGMATQVAAASEEQSSAAEQISKNIDAISSVTQESASGVQQIARASEDLNRLTINLQDLMSKFKIGDNKSYKANKTDNGTGSKLAVRSNGKLVHA
jgi:methyl-accepting chemotaxis protein